MDARLCLIVIGAIEAAHVKIDTHGGAILILPKQVAGVDALGLDAFHDGTTVMPDLIRHPCSRGHGLRVGARNDSFGGMDCGSSPQ